MSSSRPLHLPAFEKASGLSFVIPLAALNLTVNFSPFLHRVTGACAGESGMSDADGIDPVH